MGRRRRTTAGLLDVAAIEPDGLLVREDGTYVRALEVGAVNPLVLEPAEGERVSAAFGQVAARLPDRQSLQFYVQGTPLARIRRTNSRCVGFGLASQSLPGVGFSGMTFTCTSGPSARCSRLPSRSARHG